MLLNVVRRPLLVLEILLLCATPILYACLSVRAPDPDPFVYAQAAKQVIAGNRLYDEAWQDKPPLGILVYAIPQLFVPRSYAAISCFLGLCLVAQGLLIRWAFRDNLPAALFCLLLVLLLPMTSIDYSWPSTEHFGNIFVTINLVLAYTIFNRWRFNLWQCVAAGVATCLAFHIRQNIVFCGLLPFAGMVFAAPTWKSRIRGALAMAAGGLACWGVILAIMSIWGDLHGYFYICFQYPRMYAKYGDSSAIVELVRGMLQEALLPIIAVPLIGMALLSRHRKFTLLLLLVGTVSCVLPKRPYAHYWVSCFPFLAITAGVALSWSRIATPKLAWRSTAVLAIVLTLFSGVLLRRAFKSTSNLTLQRIAAAADKVAPPGATLFACGNEPIQFASKMPPAHLYSVGFQLSPPWCDMLPQKLQSIYDEYLNAPPTVIVINQLEYDAVKTGVPLKPEGFPNFLKLTGWLMERHAYTRVRDESGWVILVKSASPTVAAR